MTDFAVLDLDALRREVADHRREAREAYGDWSPDELAWRSNPDRWSVGQCLQHLVVTDDLYIERFESVASRPRRGGRVTGPFRGGLVGRWFTHQIGPVVGRKFKAPATFAPGVVADLPPDVVERFVDCQTRLESVLGRLDGLDLDRIRIASPVTPVLRFRVIDALRIVVAHDARHLLQARRMARARTTA